MKKFTKIIAAAAALVLSIGIFGCYSSGSSSDNGGSDNGEVTDNNDNTDNTDTYSYPDFYNPEETEETSEKYKINVVSKGGLKLDGVRVTAKNKEGVAVKTGISSDGVINLGITLGEYTLEVDEDSLPDGYYLEEGVTYTTNAEKREEVTIEIPSKVVSQAASSSTVYEIGDIVNDFTFRTYDSKTYKLSSLLQSKKAVILNFWYPDCSNCTTEFPYLNSAYNTSGSNVAVLGVCLTTYTESDISDYDAKHELDFPLGLDPSGLHSRFSVSAWPTTVVIDRYGMYAYRSEGAEPNVSFWQSLFTKYASDDYVQSIDGSSTDDSGNSSGEKEYPDVTGPSNDEMIAAASTSGLEATYRFPDSADEPYSWPWVVTTDDTKGGSVLATSNTGKGNSYASLYVDVAMKANQVLSFDYYLNTEAGCDILYVLLDGQIVNDDGWSGSTGWQTTDIYVSDKDKTVELAFIYNKDDADANSTLEDVVKIDNISVRTVTSDMDALDVIREAAYGDFNEGKYENYVKPVMGTDGFYHVGLADGPLLYISINNITQWSAAHTTDNKFTASGTSMYATLYLMTYYTYYNSTDENNPTTYIGEKNFEDVMVSYHHMLDADALEAPYYLMPVSQSLKEWAQDFAAEYEEKTAGKATHENEWLEFCYYYDHYGKAHADGEVCKKTDDVTQGLTIYNPIEIEFTSTPSDGENMGKTVCTVEYPLTMPNSVYYSFTAPKTGVYQIRDYKEPDGAQESKLYVYTLSENGLSMVNIDSCEGVSDFDQYIYTTKYFNFNAYLELEEGVTYYFEFMIEEQQTGKFTFDIIYHDSVDTLFDCATGGGAWTYMQDDGTTIYIFLGIKYALGAGEGESKCYYMANDDGEPDYTRKIYINMTYASYYIDGTYNNYSVEELMETNLVTTEQKATLTEYLEKAEANTGDYYGLVEADETIVNILAAIIAKTDDASGGAGNGWLAFAVYNEHFGN